jgi:hypothetical protein
MSPNDWFTANPGRVKYQAERLKVEANAEGKQNSKAAFSVVASDARGNHNTKSPKEDLKEEMENTEIRRTRRLYAFPSIVLVR